MNREELIRRLMSADEEISMIVGEYPNRLSIVIAGGSALVLKGVLSRATVDIDAIGAYQGIESVLNKYDINSRINAFCDLLPYNYEDRLEKVDIHTKIVDYYTLSLEDLVLMKLNSDRKKDYLDVTSKEVLNSIDWDKLVKLVDDGEMNVSFNEYRYRLFLKKFEEYVEEYRPK